MAESAVSSSVNLLGKILIEEGKYLWGAEEKVKELQQELLWMQSFLRKADEVQHKDQIVWMWVCQVQKYVYEAEDVIDKFVIKVVSQRRQNGWRNKMIRYSCIFKELYNLHLAASNIDSLKVKIAALSPKFKEYGLMRTFGLNTDHVEELQADQLEHIHRYVHVENKKIIGLEKNAKEIINALTSNRRRKTFHAIYGMGGLGKTTLATKVLHDDEVKQHFSGGQAFSYVSKKFKVENVLLDLLQQLDSKTSFHALSRNELDVKLREVLQKKCLIVLDDVWTKQGWDSLKTSFTSWEGDTGSKLLLTTRKEEVAKYVDDEALQKPDSLNGEESLQLLEETMRWGPREISTHEQEHSEIVPINTTVSEEKIELVNKMLIVCKGLPLSIVVLGGILKKKQSVSEWKSVLDDISSHLLMGYDHGRSCMEIVLQSYDDLPYQLKPLFLHLAIFPEDYEIQTLELYSMWVGEGLVTRSGFGGGGGRSMSMEDVANVYLRDLAEAGFVQVVESSDGWIKSIRMHDLVRDVCLEKASAENLVKTFDQHQFNASSSSSDNYYNDKMLLRVAITFEDGRLMKDCTAFNSKHLNCIRSLILNFEGTSVHVRAYEVTRLIASAFQLLRVLVFRNLNGSLSTKIGKLVHLRYLSLRENIFIEVPSSIGKLTFLEILDLRVKGKLVIPNTLWKLFRLRHLLLPEEGYMVTEGGRLRVDTLIYLETILNLKLSNLEMEGVSNIKSIREISFREEVDNESAIDILAIVEKSSYLRSCKLAVKGSVISENPEYLLSFSNCKIDLEIRGMVDLPENNISLSFPTYLTRIYFYQCVLKEDHMGILGSLSHLQTLECIDGYAGEKLSCKLDSFPLLTSLKLHYLRKWEVMEAEKGSMPKLEILSIVGCRSLSRISDILPPSLQSLMLYDICDDCMPENTECGAQIVYPYVSGEWLKDAVLSEQDKAVVVILGKSGAGKAAWAFDLPGLKDVRKSFDVVANTFSSSSSSSTCLLPRSNLEQLLMDLTFNSFENKLSQMSDEEVKTEIKQVMQQRKCLVILLNLELSDFLEEELEETFGYSRDSYAKSGSKLVITFSSDDGAASLDHIPSDYRCFILGTPTPATMWIRLYNNQEIRITNAGLRWNSMRHHSSHPLLTAMFMRLLETKENLEEWASEHKKLLNDENPMELLQLFEMYYHDFPPHLRRCLFSLARFSGGVDVSINKLYKMWILAGFVGNQKDDVQNTEEQLQELASTYLNELVKRGMVTLLRKKCQLKFVLRDMCLAKSKEDHTLNALKSVDLKSVTSPSSSNQQLSSHEGNSSLTSLQLFPDINIPLCNAKDENWEWLLYICKHFELMRVLNVEGMWMLYTKGRLPGEVGCLTHLRYLSLRGTWVTQLPSSLENLTNLQTLDLRVRETMVIPNVLWKLKCLVHLYLPQDFVPLHARELQLSGLSCLQTLVNLDADKVVLKHLSKLKLLTRLTIRKIHQELPGILAQLSESLELCIDSKIINDDPTIIRAKFHYLKKLKIEGTISIEFNQLIFPSQLEELTLKHTRLEENPVKTLEVLHDLKRIIFDRASFLGKEMKISWNFASRADLIMVCSLWNLETLQVEGSSYWSSVNRAIKVMDCPRLKNPDWFF